MDKVKGDYWKINERTVKLQIKTNKEQHKIEEALCGWECVSYGYIPKTKQDIYVFEKTFESELDCIDFLKSSKLNKLIEMKEVQK